MVVVVCSSPFECGSDIGSPGGDGPPLCQMDPLLSLMAAYQVPPYADTSSARGSTIADHIYRPRRRMRYSRYEEPYLPAIASPLQNSPGYVPESDRCEDKPDRGTMRSEEDTATDTLLIGMMMDEAGGGDFGDDARGEDEEEELPALDVERLLALTITPPSPLTPLSSPLPHIPSPPFPASPLASPIRPLGYRAAMIRLRAETPSTSHPLPLPTSLPLLYELRESSAAAATRPIGGRRIDYGFVGTMDTEIRRWRAEEAWGHSIEVSYMTHSEILALRSVVMGQQAVILQLQAADRLETQMAEFQRQLGPEKGLAQPNAPGEAGMTVVILAYLGYFIIISENYLRSNHVFCASAVPSLTFTRLRADSAFWGADDEEYLREAFPGSIVISGDDGVDDVGDSSRSPVIPPPPLTITIVGLGLRSTPDFHITSPEGSALLGRQLIAVTCRNYITSTTSPLPPSLSIPSSIVRGLIFPESEEPPLKEVDAEVRRRRIRDVGYGIREFDLLMGDRMELSRRHVWMVWMVEEEAYASREAWAHSIGLSQATHQELQTHRDHVYAHETYLQAHQTQLQLQSTLIQTQHQVHETRFQMQHAELAALRETDRRRQDQMVETLRVIRDMRREMSDMQTELLALREPQRRARQPGPEARIPDHQEASGDADSHI
ncbi:hypothetical protein Tco_0625469 [Tanacetum coccineum]|uniref:Uncharacterized protein n=1 Tax=Tanacetum coccineum TaxID=301880 RepID=A0ABQ4WGZ4_9ASTR